MAKKRHNKNSLKEPKNFADTKTFEVQYVLTITNGTRFPSRSFMSLNFPPQQRSFLPLQTSTLLLLLQLGLRLLHVSQ
ncbi:uncharacterized protein OCT59_002152 [Rhizophagus irregularis]|uniref:Uncharacterized protein n=1 Tax=Rhizophagus irregularis (strain DAOM 181602 / DAOM 197198 / MUCL 43194) TaxID=747089 RepID=U9UD40_RHIID|nr:hypothetical protein OCT59_002152 [Rhizophagus irregularis]GBC47214.1 hypothetical protein RIR_jg37933.t1 [Rhizophagus irregularis DAOM 181602=DAOM 197198]